MRLRCKRKPVPPVAVGGCCCCCCCGDEWGSLLNVDKQIATDSLHHRTLRWRRSKDHSRLQQQKTAERFSISDHASHQPTKQFCKVIAICCRCPRLRECVLCFFLVCLCVCIGIRRVIVAAAALQFGHYW